MRMRDFDIVFSGLSLGEHHFLFELNDTFFALYDYTEHSKLKAIAEVTLHKHNTFLDLTFAVKGEIEVVCDRSNEPFMRKIKNSFGLMVKFGETYDDTDDENLILPQGEYQLNVAQYLFELVVLAIPAKNIHPDVKSGKISLDYHIEEEPEEEIKDPRWDKLKDLLN